MMTANNNNNNNIVLDSSDKYKMQMTLTGSRFKVCKDILNDNHFFILSLIDAHKDTGFTLKKLYSICGKKMHRNTMSNFIEKCKINGWIEEHRKEINPWAWSSPDRRFKHYKITHLGIKIYEDNLDIR